MIDDIDDPEATRHWRYELPAFDSFGQAVPLRAIDALIQVAQNQWVIRWLRVTRWRKLLDTQTFAYIRFPKDLPMIQRFLQVAREEGNGPLATEAVEQAVKLANGSGQSALTVHSRMRNSKASRARVLGPLLASYEAGRPLWKFCLSLGRRLRNHREVEDAVPEFMRAARAFLRQHSIGAHWQAEVAGAMSDLHLHMHGVAIADHRIPVEAFDPLAISGGDTFLSVTACHTKPATLKSSCTRFSPRKGLNLEDALRRTLRYPSKPVDVEAEHGQDIDSADVLLAKMSAKDDRKAAGLPRTLWTGCSGELDRRVESQKPHSVPPVRPRPSAETLLGRKLRPLGKPRQS